MIKKLSFLKNKRANELLSPTIIRIIIYLIFFSIFFYFLHNASNSAYVYEQIYAKQIALLIDGSNPKTKITLNFSKAIEIAEKNNLNKESELVTIKDNKIFVKLSNNGGYSLQHFTNNDVNLLRDENNLIILINEK